MPRKISMPFLPDEGDPALWAYRQFCFPPIEGEEAIQGGGVKGEAPRPLGGKVKISDPRVGVPFSNEVQVTLTDYYQLTMLYAYWKAGKHDEEAVFDVYFRKCPFKGEFAIFAGVDEVIRFVNTLGFTEEQMRYLKEQIPNAEPEFFDYLGAIDSSKIRIYSIREGTMVFPREPLLRVEGPLAVCQLIETTILNLVNFPTLVATNAARHRLVAGWDKLLLEFGARRAQGPDGAVTASRYSYMGSFDGTSNVRAGHLFGIPVKGTHAHAFVTAFSSLKDLKSKNLEYPKGVLLCEDFVGAVLKFRRAVVALWPHLEEIMHEGELAAFIAYAQAFPKNFLCLVDTYDTVSSGIPNFLSVCLALHALGFEKFGIRLDSGDLAYLSQKARQMFLEMSKELKVPFERVTVVASNDINEKVLIALNNQQHQIDSFGIGTNLVTCQAQPALGMVYKLAEIGGKPCMKLSQEIEKTSIPARKAVFRLFTKKGEPVVDLIQKSDWPKPQAGQRVFCRHLLDDNKRCYVVADKVEELLELVWDCGIFVGTPFDLESARDKCISELQLFRPDQLRPVNPTPYKVSGSGDFYDFFRRMWEETSPVFTIE